VKLAPEHEARPHARPDREEGEVVDAPGDSLPALADRGEVDVVLEPHGKLEGSAQRFCENRALEVGDVRRESNRPVGRVDGTGNADDDAVDELPSESGHIDERVDELRDRLQRGRRMRAVQLDVLPRANAPGQVADRAANETRAEVDPEDQRRLRNGLEEDRSVARAVAVRRRLADEARVEKRLQGERDRRLRDPGAARDLGARDRRAGADRVEHRSLVEILE
jgi:hypothetical protein